MGIDVLSGDFGFENFKIEGFGVKNFAEHICAELETSFEVLKGDGKGLEEASDKSQVVQFEDLLEKEQISIEPNKEKPEKPVHHHQEDDKFPLQVGTLICAVP